MLRDGFVMQHPKNTSQRIAFTRLERIQRLPVALWGLLKAQGETGTTGEWYRAHPNYSTDCGSTDFPS